MEDVFKLRLQFVLRTRQSHSAVKNSPAARGRSTTSFSGTTLRPVLRVEDPVRTLAGNEPTGVQLTLPVLHTPRVLRSSRRSGKRGISPVQADGDSYTQPIKKGPTFDCTKAKFPV